MNDLYLNDCLNIVKNIKNETIDLIYLNPPFFTQKIQKLSNKNGIKYSFNDKWNSKEDYLSFIKDRIIEFKRVLKNTGNIFLHCDNKVSHNLRCLLDDVFGEDNFRSEIIWNYKKWSNSKKNLLQAHQTIFFYSKTKNFKFNTIYQNYSLTTNIDQILQKRTRNELNKSSYKYNNNEIVFDKEKKGVPLSDVWNIHYEIGRASCRERV